MSRRLLLRPVYAERERGLKIVPPASSGREPGKRRHCFPRLITRPEGWPSTNVGRAVVEHVEINVWGMHLVAALVFNELLFQKEQS